MSVCGLLVFVVCWYLWFVGTGDKLAFAVVIGGEVLEGVHGTCSTVYHGAIWDLVVLCQEGMGGQWLESGGN